jgi:tetratricopeptide (TPR) repeat protein
VNIPAAHQSVALAWQFLQAGKLAAADEMVRPLLAGGISDELLPLVGAIRMQQGRFSEAAPLFERARALNPREVRFAFLHGTALAGMNQFEPAVSAFQAAMKLEPNIPDIYLALGQAQRKLEQFEEAQSTYRKLLRIQPNSADGYMALSSVLAETGQFAQAEAPLRRALQYARDPKVQAAIHNNLAIVLENQARHAEALESLERTQALTPELPGLGQRRINTLFQLKRFEECLQLYKELLNSNPNDTGIHRAYNSLLYRLGRTDEYLTSYDRAPQTREILLAKAGMLGLQKRGAEMAEICSTLLARDPLDSMAAAGWANSLALMGRHAEAVAAFEAVISRSRADPALLCSAAGAALLAADPQKAEHFCRAGLRLRPYDQACLAFLGTAWRLQNDAQKDAQDETLNGYDSLIRVFDLDPPDGFSSMEDFNAELGAYLERLHPKTDAYLEQSLRGGTQTEGTIFGAGHVLVEKLKVRIEEAIATYVGGLPADDGHPMLARRSHDVRFAGAWSSLLRDQGFHVNHLHPDGWISSCYYVTVPEETKDSEARHGWIKFGEPELNVPLKNPVRRAVQPIPGRLVLFPSYMWHGTIPFHSVSARTTIAFDAVPQ